MEWVTTSLLLDRLQEVDQDAWTAFVGRFRTPLVAFGRRLGLGDEEAEDAAQETLLSFMRSFREGRYDRAQGRLRSWLFAIARNRVVDVARRRRSKEQQVGASEYGSFWSALGDDEGAEAAFDESWRASVFEACLAHVRKEVKPQTFAAFELTALEQLPPDEAAERLGMTRNAVFIAKHRVMTKLRERVGQYEDVSTLAP